MAVNITNLAEIIQRKIYSVSSSTSVTELNDLLKAAKLADDSVIREYDSDGSLPTAASSNERLAYITSNGVIRFNTGSAWQSLLSGGQVSSEGGSSEFYQGTTSGYMSSGYTSTRVDTIDKWSFSSDGNATDVGDVTIARERGSGQSSNVSGYTSGGVGNSLPTVNANVIDKFPFASDGDATDVGDLTGYFRTNAGQSSENHGYSSGGHQQPVGATNVIQKFPFASDGNATDVGDRTLTGQSACGQNSTTSGYTSGGSGGSPPAPTNVIDKFPFAYDANSTDVGDLFSNSLLGSGQSSSTHGYVSGGRIVPVMSDVIQKFSFSSDGNATDVGDLLVAAFYLVGQSSNVSGYVSGGTPAPSQNIIQKFPFSTDANSTDVGDLTQSRYGGMGQQV